MSTWKARPTTYRGIQMRSRLEARFAATLDAIGHPWQYEPRAFGSRDGQYLPDFLVDNPVIGPLYIEVKPTIELAMRALARMQIILASDASANLTVIVPDIGSFSLWPAASDEAWRWDAARSDA